MGRHYRSRYRPPNYRTARLVLVPLLAAVLAVVGLATQCTREDSAWTPNSPTTSTGAPASLGTGSSGSPQITSSPVPSTQPPIEIVTLPAPAPAAPRATSTLSQRASAPTTSPGYPTTEPSDQHRHRNFSPRSDPVPESIQGCQRSAASCFESGGLGGLASNLQVMKIDPVTGRFCFAFQPECSR